jgi:hypothetical protein
LSFFEESEDVEEEVTEPTTSPFTQRKQRKE